MEHAGWLPPVLKTSAVNAQGIEDLEQAVQRHRAYLRASGAWYAKETGAIRQSLNKLVIEELSANWKKKLPPGLYETILQSVLKREISPRAAARALLAYNSE